MNTTEKNFEKQENNMGKPLAFLFGGLFLLASIGGLYLLIQNNELEKSKELSELEYDDLNVLKENLEMELDEIESNFTAKIAENDTLSMDIEMRVKEIEKLQWRLNDAKSKLSTSVKENEAIQNRLVQLESLKTSLQADIAALATSNTELKLANEEIRESLAVSNEYAASLNDHLVAMSEKNERLINRLYAVAPAGFVAENFIVKAEKRNDKLTAKAKYTDEVKVSFDLNDVPDEYHEAEEIYLVVTQFDGRPLEQIDTKSVEVVARERFEIKAADIETLTLKDRQQVEMSFDADKELESGMYNLLVYADHGFLGATSFQLR